MYIHVHMTDHSIANTMLPCHPLNITFSLKYCQLQPYMLLCYPRTHIMSTVHFKL